MLTRNLLLKVMLSLQALLIGVAASCQVSFGDATLFNKGWRFHLGDETVESASSPSFDDSAWRSLDLPHDWSIEGQLSPTLASCTGYLPGGIGWYRKHFTAEKAEGENTYIYFEGVYNRSSVYLNGHLLGYRPNGYASFLYDMTPYLAEGDNVISVRVDHSKSADSRWYTGSGIYRDVYIVKAPSVHLGQWGSAWRARDISQKSATLDVDWSIDGELSPSDRFEIKVEVKDEGGKVVDSKKVMASSKKGTVSLTVRKPFLWNLDSPYLYNIRTTLLRNGQAIDRSTMKAGIRSIEFDPDRGFFLNGRNMKIKGVCIHHDAGVLGAVVPGDVWKRRLENLKKIGVNAIRMSHNPQAPVVYDLCDRLGFLVMDEGSDEWEFPKRKWLQGWNVGTPGFEGSYDFFEEWIDTDVADMVRRDRNHPSIIMWSVGNEVDYPNDPYSHPVLDGSKINQPMFGGYKSDAPDAMRIGKIAKRIAGVIRSIDASRPVTGALAGVVMSNETEYPDAVDIVGYNYTEDRYDIDHEKYPERVIYGSENSVGYKQWKAVTDRDFIAGQFLWTGTDYLGEAGAWPSRGLYTGLLDLGSFPKPRGWFRASLWSDSPVTYIGTYPAERGGLSIEAWDDWNYEKGRMTRVVCYTNSPYAQLKLNGKTVGEKKPYDSESGIIHWDIPFEEGNLTAEGISENGQVESSYTIRTSGRPYSLSVSADKTHFDNERSVIHLTVNVLDDNGVDVKLGDSDITCTIKGPARLLGLEGSNNRDMSDYTDNHHRAYRGRLLAYIAPTEGSGEIVVTFTSPLLEGTSITLSK